MARRLAREQGLDLSRIRGTGPGGRVVLADVERVQQPGGRGAEEKPEPGMAGPEEAPVRTAGKSVKIRRIVARKMLESWQTIPHFFVTVAVDRNNFV